MNAYQQRTVLQNDVLLASLSGSATGSSTASGALFTPVLMAGSAAGTSSAVGGMTTTTLASLSGGAHGTSTVAGRLVRIIPPTTRFRVSSYPPLRLETTIDTPSGRQYRWADDEPNPENVPSSETFGDTMPGGCDSYTGTLARRDGVSYADLARLSKITVRGPGGDIAWRGRLETPAVASGDQSSVSVGGVGMQAHLDDNEGVQVIYVAADPSMWTDAPLDEQIRVTSTGISYGDMSWSQNGGGLICALPSSELTSSVAEIWFIAPSGQTIYGVIYIGTETTMPAGWESPNLFSHSDTLEAPATADAMIFDGAMRSVVCSNPSRAVSMRVFTVGMTATPADGSQRSVSEVAVYGNTGVPLIPRTDGPHGVLASDVIKHALRMWCPQLKYSDDTIPDSSFVLPHLVFNSLPNKVSDIVKGATQYEMQDWYVDDNDFLNVKPRGSEGRHWVARTRDIKLQKNGPQMAHLWNSVIVQYNDPDGTTRTVGPIGSGCDTEDQLLTDPDPLNPATVANTPRRAVTSMGSSRADGAILVGRMFLQESKLLDTSGQATIVGWADSVSGIKFPAWKPRAGDFLSVVDSSERGPRRIVSKNYDKTAKAATLQLDTPPDGLAALLERLSLELVSSGLQ